MSVSGLCIEVYREMKRRLGGDCQGVNLALLVRETEDGEEVLLQPAAYQDLKGKWNVVSVGTMGFETIGIRGGNMYEIDLTRLEEEAKENGERDSRDGAGEPSVSAGVPGRTGG